MLLPNFVTPPHCTSVDDDQLGLNQISKKTMKEMPIEMPVTVNST